MFGAVAALAAVAAQFAGAGGGGDAKLSGDGGLGEAGFLESVNLVSLFEGKLLIRHKVLLRFGDQSSTDAIAACPLIAKLKVALRY